MIKVKINKYLILFMVLLIMSSLGIIQVNSIGGSWDDAAVTDWYDPMYTTFTIDSEEKLAGVAKLVNNGTTNFNGNVLEISKDMNLSSYEWVPIGTASRPFKGTLIAKGGSIYTLSELRINSGYPYVGLIGYMDGSTIGGLTVSGSINFTRNGDVSVAGIAGKAVGSSTIYNTTNNVSININVLANTVYAGGILGEGSGTISNATNNAAIAVNANNAYLGGIVGRRTSTIDLKIKNGMNSGSLTGTGSVICAVGGMVGYAESTARLNMAEEDTTIANSGNITANGSGIVYSGGVVGYAHSSEKVSFSNKTTNAGSINVSAANANSAYVGGLVGRFEGNFDFNFDFTNTGAITNHGKTDTFTGGLVGFAGGTVKLDHSFTNGVDIRARGTDRLYTAGIIGSAQSDITFNANARNTGGIEVENSFSETYTGGLVGHMVGRLILHSTSNNAYLNNGNITVTGGTGVYTGGIVSNRGYTKTADNVNSTGNITVTGNKKIYTGGFFGMVSGTDADISNESFFSTITVTASTSDTDNKVCTGGIVGYYEKSGTISGAIFSGAITASGGADCYTGGIAGYFAGGTLSNNKVQNASYTASAFSFQEETAVGLVYEKAGEEETVEESVYWKRDQKGTVSGLVYGEIEQEKTVSESVYEKKDPEEMIVAFIYEPVMFALNEGDAAITSNGYAGGIAGFINGIVNAANVKDLVIKLNTPNGYLGGLVGKAQGTITNVAIGDANKESVAIEAMADGISIGGIVGKYEGSQNITSSSVTKTEITTENGNDNCIIGGITSAASADVTLGTPLVPLEIQEISITAQGSDSFAGGAIGVNDSADIYVKAENITLNSHGDKGIMGGIAGKNRAPLSNTNISQTKNIHINAIGDHITAGGIFGENEAVLTGVKAQNVSIVSDGISSIGGTIGVNSGTLAALEAINPNLLANGSDSFIGGIVGVTQGEITNAKVSKDELSDSLLSAHGSNSMIGGIAGFAQNTEISGNGTDNNAINVVINTGDTANGTKVGGALGQGISTPISDVLNEGCRITINGANSVVGGMVGFTNAKIENVKVLKPIITVNASADSAQVGGIVGFANAPIENVKLFTAVPNYGVLSIKSEDAIVGGIAGKMENADIKGNGVDYNIENLIISTTAGANNIYSGGIIGYNDATRIEKIFAQNVKMVVNGTDSIVGGMAGYNKGTDTAIFIGSFLTGLNLTVNDTAAGATVGGITGINDARGGALDAPADILTAISSLQNSRSVGSIVVYAPNSITGGMIGENRTIVANNSVTDNLPLVSEGDNSLIGGLTGKNTSTIYYAFSNASLTIGGTGTYAGGLVGENTGEVLSSYVETDVLSNAKGNAAGYSYLGGLVGKNSGGIKESYMASTVNANGAYTCVGGLVGEHTGTIINSYAAKDVTAKNANSFAGGLLGRITTGTVTNSYSAGNITGTNGAYAGGFIGRYDNADKGLVTACYYVKDEDKQINSGLLDFADGNYYELNLYMRLSPILSATLGDRNIFPNLSEWTFNESPWKYGSVNADYKYPELNLIAGTGGEPGGDPGDPGSGDEVNISINWYTKDINAVLFQIGSEAELAGLAAIVNGTVVGTEKFDFSGRIIEVTAPIHIQANQWTPIGNTESNAFQGTFDGKNNLISGLRVSHNTYAGLFGVIGQNAAVTNVNLEPVTVSGAQAVGALAGLNKGTVSHVSVTLLENANIIGGTQIGGILGKNTGNASYLLITIDEDSIIKSNANAAMVGGIIGENTNPGDVGNVTVKIIKGSIEATGNSVMIGGITGQQNGDLSDSAVEIMGEGFIKSTGANVLLGGITGHYTSGHAENISLTFINGKIEATGPNSLVGGLIGKSEKENQLDNGDLRANNSASIINIIGNGVVGGIVGEKLGNSNNSYDMQNVKVENVIISSDTDNGITGGIGGKFTDVVLADSSFDGVLTGSADNVKWGGVVGDAVNTVIYKVDSSPDITLTTAAGESALGGIAGIIKAADDVDKAYNFGQLLPVYKGIFETNTINGKITINAAGNTVDLAVGGTVGINQGASIYNSQSQGNIMVSGAKNAYAGGMVGYSNDAHSTMVNCEAQVNIDASLSSIYHVGGFIGYVGEGKIYYSRVNDENNKSITIGAARANDGVTPATHAGGFAGQVNNATIKNSTANIPLDVNCDNLHNTLYVGGFAGMLSQNTTGIIEKSYAHGQVSVNGKAGAYAGGFAGHVNRYIISEAYADGDVSNSASDARSGGFVGDTTKDAVINKSYAAQSSVAATGISGATRVYSGGFAAYNNGSLDEVYAGVSSVSAAANGANSYVGSFIGYNFRDGDVNNSYYSGDLSAIKNDATGAQSVTKTEFANRTKFADWDFSTNNATWSYIEGVNNNRPVLAGIANWSFMPDVTVFLDQVLGTSEFTVKSGEQLAAVGMFYNDLAYYQLFNRAAMAKPSITKVALGNDIDLAGKIWTPLFELGASSEFDGNAKTVNGLYQYADAYDTYGFVAENKGTIRDVTFADADLTSGTKTGIVAGKNSVGANIINVGIGGVVKGTSDYIGGVAGYSDGNIAGITMASNEIAGVNYVGGVVGKTTTETNNITAQNSVKVSATGDFAGGIAGETTSDIKHITINDVTVTGRQNTAGIAGKAVNVDEVTTGSINVTGTDQVGGIAGEVSGIATASTGNITLMGDHHIGGIAGTAAGGITAVTINGVTKVTGTGNLAGGVVGSTTGDIAVVKAGAITVTSPGDYVGGIIGEAVSAGASIAVDNTGDLTITANEYVGGVVGAAASSITKAAVGDVKVAAAGDFAGGIAGKAVNVNGVAAGKINVTGAKLIGGIVGEVTGIITNAITGGITVKGDHKIGGIAGAAVDSITGITINGATEITGTGNLIGGLVGTSTGDIIVAKAGVITVTSPTGDYVGGIIGEAVGAGAAIAVDDSGQITVNADEYVGGVAGSTASVITKAKVGNVKVMATGDFAGGIAGKTTQNISNVTAHDVEVRGINYIGGIAGKTSADIITVTVNGTTQVTGNNYIGGLVGGNDGIIDGITLKNLVLSGNYYLGGISGYNANTIKNSLVETDLTLQGDFIGGITGQNTDTGIIENTVFKGNITADGSNIGGIAGENAGEITKCYTRGNTDINNNLMQIIAGGITGENTVTGTIRESFSLTDINILSATSSIGGIAGESSGDIIDSYNSGSINTDGVSMARAGGITGYALAGTISNALNYGQVAAGCEGKLVFNKTFAGGIAGQIADGVTLSNLAFDRQMLRANIAYYNDDGIRVKSVANKVVGLMTKDFINGAINNKIWMAVQGFYPKIKHFSGINDAILSTAAIALNEDDTIHSIISDFTLTDDDSINWEAQPNEIEIDHISGKLTGVLKISGHAALTVSVDSASRVIDINKPALRYDETAIKPVIVDGSKKFTDNISVELKTTEPNGTIYYTLNGKQPTEDYLLYAAPINITETTTIKAVTIVEGKNNSDIVSAIFEKTAPSGGGGGGGIPETDSTVDVIINSQVSGLGKAKTIVEGERTRTVISLDEQKFLQSLEKADNQAVVTIPFNSEADAMISEFNGQMVKTMENKQTVIEVKTQNATYTLPAQQINITAVSEQLGKNVELQNVRVQVEISQPANDMVKVVENAAKKGQFTIVAPPVEFAVRCTYENKTAEVSSFNSYVERTLAIPEGIDPSKISTGIVIEPDGTVRHVPTKIISIDGKYYAKINSLTNSTYSIVLHQKEFSDVEKHWAKEAVNDMGARMVISGVSNNMFEPNRDITRAEFATIVVRALGLRTETYKMSFADVKATDWYAGFIETAYAYNLISGFENGTFDPMEKITREQSMSMIARAMSITGLEVELKDGEAEKLLTEFADAEQSAAWAREGIASCLKTGIVTGKDGKMLVPKDDITRAEVAVIIERFLQKSNLI